jgi:hypothetical protein
VAVRARVAAVEFVYAASKFTVTVQPVGGVVSTITLIPDEGVSTFDALSVARVISV